MFLTVSAATTSCVIKLAVGSTVFFSQAEIITDENVSKLKKYIN